MIPRPVRPFFGVYPMASQAPNMLPLLYNGLEPLNRNLHANYKVRRLSGLDRVSTAHAIPVTVD